MSDQIWRAAIDEAFSAIGTEPLTDKEAKPMISTLKDALEKRGLLSISPAPALLSLREAQGLLNSIVEYDDACMHREAVDALLDRIDAILSGVPTYPESVVKLVTAAKLSHGVMRECGWQIALASEPEGDGVLQAAATECYDKLLAAIAPFKDIGGE